MRHRTCSIEHKIVLQAIRAVVIHCLFSKVVHDEAGCKEEPRTPCGQSHNSSKSGATAVLSIDLNGVKGKVLGRAAGWEVVGGAKG